MIQEEEPWAALVRRAAEVAGQVAVAPECQAAEVAGQVAVAPECRAAEVAGQVAVAEVCRAAEAAGQVAVAEVCRVAEGERIQVGSQPAAGHNLRMNARSERKRNERLKTFMMISRRLC